MLVIDGVNEIVVCNALKELKLSILNIVDKRIAFYSHNTNLLVTPKPKSSFRYLKQGIQEFHRKYVLVPADKAANNSVVVCRLHYMNTLKQELNGTNAYEETSTDEKTVVNIGIEHVFPCIKIRWVPREVFNIARGTQRMLMHERTSSIAIIA